MKKRLFNKLIAEAWPKTKQELEKGIQIAKVAIEKSEKQFRKTWPKTKQKLDKGIQVAKSALIQGEKHLKALTETSIRNSKKLSLSLQREKLYHDLGKALAATARSQWEKNKKIETFLSSVEELNQKIKELEPKAKT
jgi:hypothetical protein